MNVLIDTNIIIPLEDTGQELNPLLAEMCQLSEINGHSLRIHPAQSGDILRDRDENRRNIVLSRIKQYQEVPSPPDLSDIELKQYGWKQNNDNDRIDNMLLHALCRGAVHFLVTNDEGIHRKARKEGIQEQVHRFDQFLAFLRLQRKDKIPPPFGIAERYLHEFDVKQPFFDSLREAYEGFDQWYLRVAAEYRKAWCVTENEIVYAICIYKTETKPVITDDGTPLIGNALKLCTFKVGDNMRGRKLGERLLFAAFKHAMENNIQYVYLHTYGNEQQLLISLCLDYGFEFRGKYDGRDDVYLKVMRKPDSDESKYDPLNYAVRFYPHYLDTPEIRKFIVPIRPEYHNDLFADTSDTASGLFTNDSSMYSPQSNTIKKAYICHANTKQIRPGDILFFYRTQDRKSIECIGVVEHTYRGQEVDKVTPLVSKRTVYSREEIKEMLKKNALTILFRFLGNFPPIKYKALEEAGIEGHIQSIRQITHDEYINIFNQEAS